MTRPDILREVIKLPKQGFWCEDDDFASFGTDPQLVPFFEVELLSYFARDDKPTVVTKLYSNGVSHVFTLAC